MSHQGAEPGLFTCNLIPGPPLTCDYTTTVPVRSITVPILLTNHTYQLYRNRKSTQEDYGDYGKRIQPGEETWKGNVECVAKRRKISFM